jgi:hypothetical protein
MASHHLLTRSSQCQQMMIIGADPDFTNQLYWLLELRADETTTKAG